MSITVPAGYFCTCAFCGAIFNDANKRAVCCPSCAKPKASDAGRIAGKRAQARGQFGERMAKACLQSLGLRRVQRIETGWKIRRVQGRIVGATPMAKVPGDFTALAPTPTGARFVLIETKFRPDRLAHGDLDKHQVEALTTYHAEGAIAVVVWVSEAGAVALRWPIPSFVRGTSLSHERAKELALRPWFWRGAA